MLSKIPAFLDGNSLVHFNRSINRLIAGNSGGLIKIFNPDTPDEEPVSLDIPDNLTSLTSFGNKLLVTNTEGLLAVLNVSAEPAGDEKFEVIYTSDVALRDAVFINEGSRIICGGDDDKLVVIDHANGNTSTYITVPDQVVSVSYNATGELVAVGLSSGDVHVFSVINELPALEEKLSKVLPFKVHTSVETIDYKSEHEKELVSSRSHWSMSGEYLFVPTANNTVKSYGRSEWNQVSEYISDAAAGLIDFTFSPGDKHIALLHKTGAVDIFQNESKKLIKSLKVDQMDADSLPLNISWNKSTIYVGATDGELHVIKTAIDETSDESSEFDKEVNSLFLDQASESETEDQDEVPTENRKRNALDDSMIIDEDDDNDGYFNKSVDQYLPSKRRKARFLANDPTILNATVTEEIVPYSPGSTPWVKSINSSTSATKRRYLFMNSIGYVWSVKNASLDANDDQKSITVSFFDRAMNKDYHFIDYYNYDLSSMNERGVVLASSGYKEEGSAHSGRIFYRHHNSNNDSWDRLIPLLKNEYLTSVCVTSSSSATSGDSIIVVGTNFGYLRFFNLYGLCINLMKVAPVVTLISSAISTVFSIHQTAHNNYTYSIINVDADYSFHQQDCAMPLKKGSSETPLIKGLFFNEFSDPCVVAGNDDTLTVLSKWRETNNARWVPLLNCKDSVTDYGITDTKSNWKSWPLGLQEDKLVCLILKNNDVYPGFPLPLPVEFDIKLPVKCFKHLRSSSKADEEDGDDSSETRLEKAKQDDPEEEFLRSFTLGGLLSSAIAEAEDDDHVERLNSYSVAFDRSLLKIFANACQDSRLNKAFSVVRLVKNDKALLAASKIAERFEFVNLASKINKLRETLIEMEDEDDS